LRTGIVYAESWAFVHSLLFGKHPLPPGALTRFLAEMQKGALQEDAFNTAFGVNYAKMDTLLGEYLRSGRYYVRRMPLMNVPPPTVEPASTIDVDNALARLA